MERTRCKKKPKNGKTEKGGERKHASLCDAEFLAILLSAPSCNWHECWLVRECGSDGANAVIALREAPSDNGGEVSLAVTGVIDAFEKDESLGVEPIRGS